ncbi:hypothetical protein HOY82DRAFT_570820 [Tuber indicum]|nr:hypothetical protein HOY82DRAFT_570820 [Tuber indicum]
MVYYIYSSPFLSFLSFLFSELFCVSLLLCYDFARWEWRMGIWAFTFFLFCFLARGI